MEQRLTGFKKHIKLMLTKYNTTYDNSFSIYCTKFLFGKQWMHNVDFYCYSSKQYKAYSDIQNKSGSYIFHQINLAS